MLGWPLVGGIEVVGEGGLKSFNLDIIQMRVLEISPHNIAINSHFPAFQTLSLFVISLQLECFSVTNTANCFTHNRFSLGLRVGKKIIKNAIQKL